MPTIVLSLSPKSSIAGLGSRDHPVGVLPCRKLQPWEQMGRSDFSRTRNSGLVRLKSDLPILRSSMRLSAQQLDGFYPCHHYPSTNVYSTKSEIYLRPHSIIAGPRGSGA